MFRSVLGILAGYLVCAIGAGFLFQISGRDPHVMPGATFLVFATLYGVVFALLGGFVTGVVTRRHEIRHAAIVAVLIGLGAIASAAAQPGTAWWSQLVTLLLMAPSALAGGALRARLRRSSTWGGAPPG